CALSLLDEIVKTLEDPHRKALRVAPETVIGLRTVNAVDSVALPVGVQVEVIHGFFGAAGRTISPSNPENVVNRLPRFLGAIDVVSISIKIIRLDLFHQGLVSFRDADHIKRLAKVNGDPFTLAS